MSASGHASSAKSNLLGVRASAIKAGTTSKVKVTLKSKGRSALKRARGKLKVILTLKPNGSSSTTRADLTLVTKK